MPRLIAIDLGAHAVKVSVYGEAGRRSGLEGQFTAPVPQDGTELPSLALRLTALDSLLSIHKEWTSPANQVALVWSSENAAVRDVVLPFTDRAQVDKTLPFTIEAEVPFDLDHMLLSWRPISVGTQTKAFVALARHELVKTWLASLSERQLDPSMVVLDGEALGRIAPPDGVAAVIDVGHSHTVVSVVDRGVVVVVRAIDVGGRSFTRAIADAVGCSWYDAERLKHGGTADADEEVTEVGAAGDAMPAQAKTAIDGQMGLLLAEIRATLISAEDTHEIEVGRVLLTGGGARLEPFPSYLSQDLGVQVESVVDADGLRIPGPYAVGTALNIQQRGLSRAPVANLRVGDLAYRGGINVLRAVMTYGVALCAFFVVATVVLFVVQYTNLASEQAEYEQRIAATVTETFPDVPRAAVKDTITALSIMSERTSEAVARSEVLAADGGIPPTIDMLLKISEAFPPADEVTVDVEELQASATTITVTAETDGYASAAAVEEALQRVPEFAGATKSDDRKVRDKVAFTISIPLGASGEEGD